jgi:hypothetical protein
MVYETTLCHYGIKGQKWGLRRFQNKDGSLKAAGRKRYADDGGSEAPAKRKGMSASTKKKLMVGAGIALATAATIYAIENPNVVKMPLSAAKKLATESNAAKAVSNVLKNSRTIDLMKKGAVKSASALKTAATKASPAVGTFLKNSGSKTMTALKASGSRVGNAMLDAALLSAGTIAIGKLSNKLATDENTSEAIRDRNQIILDTATAGIKALPRGSAGGGNNKGNSGNNGNGGSVSKAVSDAIGAPSKKGNAKQDPAYNTLFKDSNGNQRDEKTRAEIKSMASAGYDIDQLKDYLARIDRGELQHSFAEFKGALNYWTARQYVDAILT